MCQSCLRKGRGRGHTGRVSTARKACRAHCACRSEHRRREGTARRGHPLPASQHARCCNAGLWAKVRPVPAAVPAVGGVSRPLRPLLACGGVVDEHIHPLPHLEVARLVHLRRQQAAATRRLGAGAACSPADERQQPSPESKVVGRAQPQQPIRLVGCWLRLTGSTVSPCCTSPLILARRVPVVKLRRCCPLQEGAAFGRSRGVAREAGGWLGGRQAQGRCMQQQSNAVQHSAAAGLAHTKLMKPPL